MRSYFRFWPVVQRNMLVWRKMAVSSVIANIAEPLMWLLAFGYGLGALVGTVTINGTTVPYLLFITSGSVCMSAMNIATFEALYSVFSRVRDQRTWDGILNAPMRVQDIWLGEMLWATFKSTFTSSIILCVIAALGINTGWMFLWAWPILVLIGMTFSCMALIFTALAKGYDFFAYYFTLLLTPMNFISGVFFPINQLPKFLQNLAQWTPLTHAVELVRPLFLEQIPQDIGLHLLVLLSYLCVAGVIAQKLMVRRFKY
jgi:lipooligosaccharide transport system permease protein